MKEIGKLRLLSTLVTAFLCVPLLAACGGSGGGSGEKSNADLLKEAIQNMKDAKSYHMKLDGAQGGQQIKLEGDINTADNKMKLDMAASGMNINVIAIGQDYYLSTDGGKTYTKSGAGAGMDFSSFTTLWNTTKPEDIDKSKDAFKDGTPKDEKVGDVNTRHITASCKDTPTLCSGTSGSTNQDTTLDLWVSNDAKPYVYRMKVAGAQSGDQSVDGSFEWSKFNETFTIEAPPTQ